MKRGLELQDYLNPLSNITQEDQWFLFSLRCEINILKLTFQRNLNIISSFCNKSCNQELDYEHFVFSQEINNDSEVKLEKFGNGSLVNTI